MTSANSRMKMLIHSLLFFFLQLFVILSIFHFKILFHLLSTFIFFEESTFILLICINTKYIYNKRLNVM